jgi:hypothetical protein
MKRKYITVAMAIILFLASSSIVRAKKSPFNGTWTINNAASDFEPQKSTMPLRLILNINKDSINIGIVLVDRNSKPKPPISASYSINGKIMERVDSDQTKVTGSCLISKTNMTKTQAIFWPENPSSPKIESKEEWIVPNDGRILTINRVVEGDGKQYHVKAVYNKE